MSVSQVDRAMIDDLNGMFDALDVDNSGVLNMDDVVKAHNTRDVQK